MWAATAWDDADWDGNRARGWTVMGRLRQRQQALRSASNAAAKRAARDQSHTVEMMRAAPTARAWKSSLEQVWVGGPVVVALLFAHPDSDAIRTLDARGEYFDCRSGDSWDLFFPGYHRAGNPDIEYQADSRQVGSDFAASWFFNAHDFNMFREEVTKASESRWRYSGGTDLVVVTGYMPYEGPITIDWESTLTGSLTETSGARTLQLEQVIERLSTDLESGAEDPVYGLEALVAREVARAERRAVRDVLVGALAGILAALARAGLRL